MIHHFPSSSISPITRQQPCRAQNNKSGFGYAVISAVTFIYRIAQSCSYISKVLNRKAFHLTFDLSDSLQSLYEGDVNAGSDGCLAAGEVTSS